MYKKLFKDIVEYSGRITLKINEEVLNDDDVKELNYYEYLKITKEIVWYKNHIQNIEIKIFGEKEVINMPENYLIDLRILIKKYFNELGLLYELITDFDFIEVTYEKGNLEHQDIRLELIKKAKKKNDYDTELYSFYLFRPKDVITLMNKYKMKKSFSTQKWKYGFKKEIYI